MKEETKKLYEKMRDVRCFAIVLLSVAVFFYLGTILPTKMTNSDSDIFLLFGLSLAFLTGSLICFLREKKYRQRLLDSEDGEDYFTKN
ncbi:hypothetical protein J9303_07635 [Bacillaceae bacterium Marseille-Q3522]|nr:hypothetical protein [Bacillaceae bacterium Marseille-Q3522]